MSRIYYETGIEEPEILGSGSSFWNVISTIDEDEAFKLFHKGRNYLWKVIQSVGEPRKIERWDEEKKCWRI